MGNAGDFCNEFLERFGVFEGDDDERLYSFLSKTKNFSIEELKELDRFFGCAYDKYKGVNCNIDCHRIKIYLEHIINIKEELELIKTDCLDEGEVERFEFYIKWMCRGILMYMDKYFETDLIKLTDDLVKKYELRRKYNE